MREKTTVHYNPTSKFGLCACGVTTRPASPGASTRNVIQVTCKRRVATFRGTAMMTEWETANRVKQTTPLPMTIAEAMQLAKRYWIKRREVRRLLITEAKRLTRNPFMKDLNDGELVQLIESYPTHCGQCEVPLTDADYNCGRCTQCRHKIERSN